MTKSLKKACVSNLQYLLLGTCNGNCVWIGQPSSLGIGNAKIYGWIYLATFLISNTASNNAAAALIFLVGEY
jgi:hypothetical protein